ncbi:lipopolysaccharide-induced tumor necrosis factor-alpha factor homolog [Embiotoca jacksoni]|uniref:lipopolysaccharide-induced tumor necrosis factor-alpha factor homolog n=1 Tax=Embiotoca jacksoni TaxID=100190 RepID=UPI0037038531
MDLKVDESFPTPLPYFPPDENEAPVYTIPTSFDYPRPPSSSLSPRKSPTKPHPDKSKVGLEAEVYQICQPFDYPPPSSSFSPGVAFFTKTHLPLPVFSTPLYKATPRPKFVSYETELYRSPAQATCPSCQAQVTTQVTFKVGTYAWLMCLLFVLCGLVLGCFLIPFFVNHFKDVYRTCPRCNWVLHVHRKKFCQ